MRSIHPFTISGPNRSTAWMQITMYLNRDCKFHLSTAHLKGRHTVRHFSLSFFPAKTKASNIDKHPMRLAGSPDWYSKFYYHFDRFSTNYIKTTCFPYKNPLSFAALIRPMTLHNPFLWSQPTKRVKFNLCNPWKFTSCT